MINKKNLYKIIPNAIDLELVSRVRKIYETPAYLHTVQKANVSSGRAVNVRSAETYPMSPDAYFWIVDKLKDLCKEVNREWNFNIELCQTQISLLRYREGDFYIKHQDVILDHRQPNQRKISMVLQLSDSDEYVGGDLVLDGDVRIPRELGTIAIFSAGKLHEVEEVIRGERKSLIIWFSGPPALFDNKWR